MTSPTKAAELADWHAQQAEQRRQALGWQGEDKVTGPALRKLHADIEFHAQACDSIRALIAPNGVIAWAHPDGRVVPASTMESAKRDGCAMESSLAGYTIPCVAALLRASEGRVPEVERDAFDSVVKREAGDDAAKRWPHADSPSYANTRVQDYRQGWAWCLEWLTATPQPSETPGPTEQDRDFMALQARKTVPGLLHRESYMQGIEDTVKFYNQKAST